MVPPGRDGNGFVGCKFEVLLVESSLGVEVLRITVPEPCEGTTRDSANGAPSITIVRPVGFLA